MVMKAMMVMMITAISIVSSEASKSFTTLNLVDNGKGTWA